MKTVGVIASPIDYQIAYLFDKEPFVILGRTINTLFGVLTVWLTFLVGRRVAGSVAGTAAALLLSVSVFHIERSQMIEVDVPLTCFVMLALLFILRLREKPTLSNYLVVGIAIGLAMSSKYTGAFLVIPLLVAVLLPRRKDDGPRRWPLLLLAVATAGLAFLVTSPYVALDFASFREHVTAERQHMAVGHFGAGETPTWQYYGAAWTQRLLGWPLAVSALLGLVLFAIVRRRSWALVLASFAVAYLLIVATWEMRVDRYLLPVLPIALVFAAAVVSKATDVWLPRQHRAVAAFIAALLLAIPVMIQYPVHARGRLAKDTRTEAREWMEEQLPAGSLIVSEFYAPSFLDPLTFWQLDQPVRDRIREQGNAPTFFATLRMPLFTVQPENTAVFYDIDLYRAADFVVTSSPVKGRYLADASRFSLQVAFYDSLEAHFDTIIEFVPEGSIGPGLTVYQNRNHSKPFGSRAEQPDVFELRSDDIVGGEDFFYYNMGLNYEAYGFYDNALASYRHGIGYPQLQRGLYGDFALGIYRSLVGMDNREEALEVLKDLERRAPTEAAREMLLNVLRTAN